MLETERKHNEVHTQSSVPIPARANTTECKRKEEIHGNHWGQPGGKSSLRHVRSLQEDYYYEPTFMKQEKELNQQENAQP